MAVIKTYTLKDLESIQAERKSESEKTQVALTDALEKVVNSTKSEKVSKKKDVIEDTSNEVEDPKVDADVEADTKKATKAK